MSSKAVTAFVDTVLQHFPPFRWEESQEQAWMDTAIRELSGFGEPVLRRAISEMIRTRKDRRIPLVSECIHACLDAKRWLDAETNKGQLIADEKPSASWGDWTTDRLQLATDLCMSPMGKEAARDGWIGALHSFARKNSRLPKDSEIAHCKKAAKDFDEAYAQSLRGGWETSAILSKLGAAMIAKREELAERVLSS